VIGGTDEAASHNLTVFKGTELTIEDGGSLITKGINTQSTAF
jgi:hypothetical protein